MAGRAGAKNLIVVDTDNRHPDICAVAILTDVRCQNVLSPFPRCISTIVTSHAIVDDIDVIKIGRLPSYCRVAVITIVATGYVSRVFARCCHAVMT